MPNYRERQRMSALGKANEKRFEMAALKRKLRAREVDPWALLRGELAEYEPTITDWTLRQLLIAVPGIGEARMYEVLTTMRASPMLKVRGLSDTRRVELARIARSAVEIVTDERGR